MAQERYEVQEQEMHEVQTMIIPSPPPRPPVAYLAVLDPRRFDNHLFWKRIYDTKQNESVLRSLEGLEKTHLVRVHHLNGNATDFPFMIEVLQRLKHISGIKQIILDCCTAPKSKMSLAAEIDFVLRTPIHASLNNHNKPDGNSNDGNNDGDTPPIPCGGFTPNNILGYPNGAQPSVQQTGSACCFLKVLGGFMMALGAAAIIAAFAILNAATLGVAGTTVAIAGAVTGLIGYSLFKKGCPQNNPPNSIYAIP
jgi:hypothetical protein